MRTKTIAVDFDGTLFENDYPHIGKAKRDVIERLKDEQDAGAKIILWTCRCGDYLVSALTACMMAGLVFDAVNANMPELIAAFGGDCRKVVADEYWDDRAVTIV